MKELCDYCVCVPSKETPRIQEAHILIEHIICSLVEEEILERRAAAFKAKDYLRLDPMGSEGYKENLQLQHRFQKPTYAEPYYEFDKDNNRVHPYGLEMADIMQKKMPPVPGLALTKVSSLTRSPGR